MKYDNHQIARELQATAQGRAYYGNALYVARDFPTVTEEEKWCIDRWLAGATVGMDHIELQMIAIKIDGYE